MQSKREGRHTIEQADQRGKMLFVLRKDVLTYHTPDSLVKDTGRSSVVERTGLLGVNDMPLVEEVVVAELRMDNVGKDRIDNVYEIG